MKKLFLFMSLLPLLVNAQTVILGGSVSGVWTAENSPYLIQGDITVDSAQTLEIRPGVRVEFQGYYGLTVNGTIKAIGTNDSMITFTVSDTTGISNSDTSLGGWRYFFVYNSIIDTTIVRYCIFEYLKYVPYSGWGISVKRGITYFNNNVIRYCFSPSSAPVGILSVSGGSETKKVKIYNNIFINNYAGACRLYNFNDDSLKVFFVNNIIANNDYAFTMWLYHDTSYAKIYLNTICNNDKVFYYLEDCSFTISNSIIYNNQEGNSGFTKINCLETYPAFYNPPQGIGPGYYNNDVNFYPTENSPAVDAGDTTGLPFIPETDLFGRPRIYGNGIDIGALEYQPGVFVDEATGKKYQISIYPNPAKEHFNIKTDLNITKVELYNLEGKKIKIFVSANYDIRNLKPDVYLLKIHSENTNQTYSVHLIKL